MGYDEIAKMCATQLKREGPVQQLHENLKKIHQVPLLCRSKKIGWFLGSIVGVVKDVDVATSGEFLRVRVIVDITKPLRRFLHVNVIRDEEEIVMVLRYESLPNHCFQCGRLGHPTRDCSERPIMKGKEKVDSWAEDVESVGLEAQHQANKVDLILTNPLDKGSGQVDYVSEISDIRLRDLAKKNFRKKVKSFLRCKRLARETASGDAKLKNENDEFVVFRKKRADGVSGKNDDDRGKECLGLGSARAVRFLHNLKREMIT
ncbi:hypothetical protein Dsin_002416 [Dipteronia sinensis]|uniref:CCHC-type domain-containing protein n=1 Tax=Dipteronia sinensis TaxID=43782 RepID=A0AAE0B715_9ROSI|nr:hypothetical protein Dsin_002416 [Dipteronia sinensis]